MARCNVAKVMEELEESSVRARRTSSASGPYISYVRGSTRAQCLFNINIKY